MKQKTKQIVIMVVVILLGLTVLSPLFAMSESEYKKFSDNEEYYQNLCASYTADDRALCESFTEYKKEKISRAKDDIKNAESTIDEIKGKIVNEEQKLEAYHNEIAELQIDIASNEKLVTKTESAIRAVETQIKEREDRIKELDELIKEFLVNMQGEMRVNGFIEFIMGASDFSDIVRRSEGMKRIKEYNEALINEVLAEKELLQADMDNLESKKIQLEDEKELLLVQIEKSKTLYEVIEKIVSELRVQKKDQENLVEQSTQISKSQEEDLKNIFQEVIYIEPDPETGEGGGSIPGGGVSSSGWGRPVGGNYSVGNGVWAYDSGGKHLGQDYPAAVGTSLLAPADGVVVATRDNGCSNNYNIYDGCGGGWGNYLNLIVNVNGSYYGLLYAHISPGGMLVGSGQQVSAGQAVAQMGSSGMSSGPHLHVEVYYLGGDVDTAFSHYTTNTFGTGGSTSERGNSRCQSNGNSAPCRVNPRSVFP